MNLELSSWEKANIGEMRLSFHETEDVSRFRLVIDIIDDSGDPYKLHARAHQINGKGRYMLSARISRRAAIKAALVQSTLLIRLVQAVEKKEGECEFTGLEPNADRVMFTENYWRMSE